MELSRVLIRRITLSGHDDWGFAADRSGKNISLSDSSGLEVLQGQFGSGRNIRTFSEIPASQIQLLNTEPSVRSLIEAAFRVIILSWHLHVIRIREAGWTIEVTEVSQQWRDGRVHSTNLTQRFLQDTGEQPRCSGFELHPKGQQESDPLAISVYYIPEDRMQR